LLKNSSFEFLSVGPMADRFKTRYNLLSLTKNSDSIKIVHELIRSPYTVFNLPETFDDYLKSLKKRQRTNYRRDINLLNKSFNLNQKIIQNSSDAIIEFKKFITMHENQWQNEGKLGHFTDWPLGQSFHQNLAQIQAQKGRLRLICLMADDQTVSYQLCYSFGNKYYWRLPARIVGTEWERFGLGRVGMIKMLEAALDEGVHYVDAGAGHYDYKVKAGGVENPLYCMLLVRNNLYSKVRGYMFSKISYLINLFYYRIWFIRLAPKLPFKQQPLWKTWIRTRL